MNKIQDLIDNHATKYVPPVKPDHGDVVLRSEDVDVVALAFLGASKVKYKYNSFDGWSIFAGDKYQAVGDINEITLWIRKFLSTCKVRKKKSLIPISRKTKGYCSDLMQTIASQHNVHLLPGQKAPCSLDNSLDPQKIIAANNCLISIKEYPFVTHPITEQFYTRSYLDYDYNKDAYSDPWNKFIAEICCGDLDLMLLLQQWAGYLLLPTLKYQKFLLCIGDGANGKGVFFDTLTAALGRNNVSNVSLIRFIDKHTLFGTYGKLVNMSNENTQDLEATAEGVVKEFVAGDKMLWEQKYKDPFFAYPTAKLMFACNELPRIRDDSDGIWRRMILAPFNAKFKGESCDIDLGTKLQEPTELAGVLNWMLQGAVKLDVGERFIRPEVVTKSLREYRDQSNSARLFLIENVEQAGPNDATFIPATMLHKWYQEWCKDNGFKPKNNVHFGHSAHRMYSVQSSRPWVGVKKITGYLGLKPREGSFVEEKLEQWTQ